VTKHKRRKDIILRKKQQLANLLTHCETNSFQHGVHNTKSCSGRHQMVVLGERLNTDQNDAKRNAPLSTCRLYTGADADAEHTKLPRAGMWMITLCKDRTIPLFYQFCSLIQVAPFRAVSDLFALT